MDLRVICQEYPIKKNILVLEFNTQGLKRDSAMVGEGVEGTIKTFSNFTGNNLFQSETSTQQNYDNNEEILGRLEKPSAVLTGKVHHIANKYYIFKGMNDVFDKDGKKIRSENWQISFGLVVQHAVNSTLEINVSEKKTFRFFKCLPEEVVKLNQPETLTPEQAQCLANTGSTECSPDLTNQ